MGLIPKLLSFLLIYLTIYPVYTALFAEYVAAAPPLTEPKEITCDSVREWELTWRPKIIYCKNPLKWEKYHSGCNDVSKSQTSECAAAVHRYCNSIGSQAGEIQEAGNGVFGTVCLNGSWYGDAPIDTLKGYNSGCNDVSKSQTSECASAIHQYCLWKTGTGYNAGIVQEVGSNAFSVLCFNAGSSYGVFENQLKSYHSGCDSISKANTADCAAAIHRFCNAHGVTAGAFQGTSANNVINLVCFDSNWYNDISINELSYSENRYFVYAHKPDNYSNVNLQISGVPSNHQIEALTANTAHWSDSSHLSIDNSGSFAFNFPVCDRYKTQQECPTNGCEWKLFYIYNVPYYACSNKYSSLSLTYPDDPNVMTIPVENCNEQVLLSTILFEEGRFYNLESTNVTTNFLNFGSQVTAMILSQIQPYSTKELPGLASSITRSDLLQNFLEDLPNLKNLFGQNPNEVIFFDATIAGKKTGYYGSFETQATRDSLVNIIQTRYNGEVTLIPGSHLENSGKTIKYDIYMSRDPKVASDIGNAVDKLWQIPTSDRQARAVYHEIIGRKIGYGDSSAKYFAEVINGEKPYFAKALYDKIDAGLITEIDQREFLVGWVHEPGDIDALTRGQTLGVLAKEIDPSGAFFNELYQYNLDGTINHKDIVNLPKINQVKIMVDSAKTKASSNFDLLSQKLTQLKPMVLTANNILKTNTLTDNILNSIDEGDIVKLTSYKAEAIVMRDSLPSNSPLWKSLDLDVKMADDAITYNLDMQTLSLRQSVYQNTGLSRKYLTIETIKNMEESGKIGLEVNNRGFLPTQETISQTEESAGILSSVTSKIKGWVQNKISEYSGQSTKLPAEQNSAFNLGKKEVAGLTLGVGLSFVFSIGPKLQQYGNYKDDNFAIVVGNAIQTIGIGLSIYAVTSMGVNTVIQALAHVSVAKILTGVVSTLALSFVISYMVGIIVNIIFCVFLMPGSPECGCYTDAAYGKKRFKLEKNGVKIGDKLHYIYYGNLYCPELEQGDVFHGAQLTARDASYTNIWSVGEILGGTYLNDECTTSDGRCFECVVDVKYPPDPEKYYASMLEWDNGLGFQTTDEKDFYICSASQQFDTSENKCVTCNGKKESSGTCEVDCGASPECDDKNPSYTVGYPDNQVPTISDAGPVSANQMRSCSGAKGDCTWQVMFDSYINEVSVNGISYGDVSVNSNKYIEVMVKVNNTGKNQQGWWFVGVEFYKVENYDDPWGTRTQRVDAWFNGLDNTSGCDPSITGCGCSYSDPNNNGVLDPGETITVTCWAPASHWGTTSDNGRMMFWVHERDLGQDAGNNGCNGDDYPPKYCGSANGKSGCSSGCPGGGWWSDALSKSYSPGIDDTIGGGPATVRVKIIDCDSDGTAAYDNICHVECGASPECDERYPATNWCDYRGTTDLSDDIRKSCNETCQYIERSCPSNNICCSGCSHWDINADNKIDAKDVAGCARAFGSKIDTTTGVTFGKWDYRCDIILDNKIDAKDVAGIAAKYGAKCTTTTIPTTGTTSTKVGLTLAYTSILVIITTLIIVIVIVFVAFKFFVKKE
jgi:hypothetical protein